MKTRAAGLELTLLTLPADNFRNAGFAPRGSVFARAESGVYLLILWLGRRRRIRVGSLGPVSFPAGLYLYSGSGRRCLAARIGRHRRRIKPARWHIDYLRRHAQLIGAAVAPWAPGRECAVARAALGAPGAREVAHGFGSSGCGCPAHLAHLGGGTGKDGMRARATQAVRAAVKKRARA